MCEISSDIESNVGKVTEDDGEEDDAKDVHADADKNLL